MKNFIMRELKQNLVIESFPYKEKGFCYTSKSLHKKGVKEINIVHPDIIDNLIMPSFDKRYKKVLEFYFLCLQEDDAESGEGKLMIALDEVLRLRNILLKKYKRFLSKKMEEKMLKKLRMLENEIRLKIIDLKLIKEQNLVNTKTVEEKSKSR